MKPDQQSEKGSGVKCPCSSRTTHRSNEVFPKWNGILIAFSEFSKFRESYKSLKHE